MCVQCVHTCYYACISNRWNSISDENRRGWGKIEVDETGYTKEKSKWRKWSKEERREKEEEWEGERERETEVEAEAARAEYDVDPLHKTDTGYTWDTGGRAAV